MVRSSPPPQDPPEVRVHVERVDSAALRRLVAAHKSGDRRLVVTASEPAARLLERLGLLDRLA